MKQLAGTASSTAIAAPPFARTRWLPWIAAALLIATAALLGVTDFAGARATGAVATTAPTFRQLTFRRGHIGKARFASDGQTVVAAVSWDGEPMILQSIRIDTRAPTTLGLAGADLEAVSRSGELAVLLRRSTLARVPIGLGGMREVLEGVKCADWAPDGTIAAMRVDGRREWLEYLLGRSIFEEPANFHSCMRVSPDGQLVAMIQQERTSDAKEWLTIVDRNGQVESPSEKRPPIYQDGLAWTPDGAEVWFGAASADVALESSIRAMTPDGAERVVHRTIGSIRIEDIAPDGRALVASDFNRVGRHQDAFRKGSDVDGPLGAERDVHLSADGHTFVFSHNKHLSDLNVAQGLK